MENGFLGQVESWLSNALGMESVGAAEMLLAVLGILVLLLVAGVLVSRSLRKKKRPETGQQVADEVPAKEDEPLIESSSSTAPESSQKPTAPDATPAEPDLPEEPAITETAAVDATLEERKLSFRQRLRQGVSRTGSNLGNLFVGKPAIDDELLEELETILLMADVGIETTSEVIEQLTASVNRKELGDSEALRNKLQQLLLEIVEPCQQPLALSSGGGTQVILVVGVNGVGKTTTIGKMARRFQSEGLSVMLAAGDTFRAAAVEQLQSWGERNSVPVVAQHTGADSASVIFDALQSAQSKGVDVLIADTAGRLHNKSNLMEELRKVTRVMAKLDETAPHEVLLVLDAGTGQNALSQMREFDSAVKVSGVALTKLDGTAKGGVIFPLCKQFSVPVRFIGVGEAAEDLQPFSAKDFVDALFSSQAGEVDAGD